MSFDSKHTRRYPCSKTTGDSYRQRMAVTKEENTLAEPTAGIWPCEVALYQRVLETYGPTSTHV